MADVQSNINVNIDTSNALSSIKLLQAQMSAFHASMSKGTATAANAASQLQQKLIDSVNATGQFSAGIQTIKTTTESFTNSLEKNKLSLGQYFKYSIGATKSFGGLFKTEMSTIDKVARERVKDLQTQYIRLGRDANGAMKAIAVRPLTLDLENLQTKTALAAQKQQILNQLLKQGSTNLLNFGKNTQWAGRQLMVGFTIPLSMAGAAAAKAYMEIEKASIQIERVYGDLSTTAEETKNVVAQIKNLASEYTRYGVAISDTMAMAAKAAAMGKTGADLLAQVNNATRLSVLGGVEQEQALETTISLTNAFGISADQLSSKINFLNAVENQTVTSIEDLTIAIPKAGPVIKQLGGDVEDLAFFLTAMKEGGINASEGANALKSGLAALINPTGKAADMLASYGINVNKIVDSNKGDVKQTVIDFAKALDTLDPLNRARAIEQMFGKFQFARLSTLFQNVVKESSQATKALGLANTSAIQLAAMSKRELDKLESSPMYKFQKTLADLQLAIAPIGETFLKAVTPVLQKVSEFLSGFNQMGDGFKQFVVVSAAVLGGLAPILLMVTGLVANGAANIIKLFANIKTFLNRATSSSQVLGQTTNYLTTEQIKAEAVAASLDQVHSKLTQTFTAESGAIANLLGIYARANAEMSKFALPGIPTTIGRKAKKMASGGIVTGPGTATSDSVPANLSNGEAVISVDTVRKNPAIIGALLAGKKIEIPGYRGSGIAGGTSQAMYNSGLYKAPEIIRKQSATMAWSSLEQERAEIDKIVRPMLEEKYSKAVEIGKLTADEAGRKINNAIKNLKDIQASHLGDEKTTTVLPKSGKTVSYKDWEAKGLAPDTGAINNYVNTLRMSPKIIDGFAETIGSSRKELEPLLQRFRDGLPPINLAQAKLLEDIGNYDAAINKSYQGAAAAATMKTRTGPGGDYYSKLESGDFKYSPDFDAKVKAATQRKLDKVDTALVNAFNDSAQSTAKTASESKRTKKIAKDTVDGFANELERGKKKIAVAAKGTADAVVNTVAKAPRRASQAQTNYDLLNLPMQGPAKPTRMQSLQSKAMGLKSKTIGDVSTGKLAGLGAAASMATFALSGMPGPIGQVANAILPVVSIFSIVSPLLATFGASLGIASLPLLPVAAGLAAVVAVVGITSFLIGKANDARKKELANINASSNAYKYAKDSVSKFAEAAGVKKKSTASDFATQSFKTDATPGQMDDVQTLLASDDFTNKDSSIFKMIQNIKKMSDAQAKAFLQAYGQTLISSGIGKESVDAEIKAIQAAAEKTKLKLTFDSIDLTSKTAQDDLLKSFDGLNDQFNGIKTLSILLNKNEKDLAKYRNAYRTFADQASNSLKGISDQFAQGIIDGDTYDRMMNGITSRIGAMTDKATQARVIGRMFSQISPEAKAFATSIGDANQQLKIYQILILGGADAMSTLQNEIARARASGGTAEQVRGWIDELINNQLADVKKAAKALNDALNSAVPAASSDKAAKVTLKTMAQLKTSIKDATTALGQQTTAFTRLTAAGIKASDALKLIQDLDLARIIANEKDAKKRKELIDLIKTQIAAEKKLKETTEPEQEAIDKANKKIAVLEVQNKIAQLGLDRISKQEDVINKAYDKRIEALDKVQEINKAISAQQQDQLDLSSALARGDMAAASRAAQKLRAAAAERAMVSQKTALENSKARELAGVTTTVNGKTVSRETLESEMSSRNDEINTIQTNEVAPNELLLAQDAVKETPAVEVDTNTPQKEILTDKNKPPKSKPPAGKEWYWNTKDKKWSLRNKAVATNSDTDETKAKKINPAYDTAIANRNRIQGQISSIDSQIAVLAKQADAIRVKFSQRRIDSYERDKQLYPINQKLSTLAQSKRLTGQALASIKIPNQYLANGGMVMPKYLSAGGFARGTDTVSAMLTPGEFVVKKSAVDSFGVDNLKAINNGATAGDSVYNYSISVNAGTNSSTDDIARAVMAKIKQVDSQRIRGNTF
jgi:TP901 family phage tail tape measure protein